MFSKKISALIMLLILFSFTASPISAATKEKENPVLRAWSHENTYKDGDQSLYLKATYYSNEYVEALVQSEAEKNLWTNDEMENYKYTLLKNLNLAESIPIHIDMYVRGMPIYPAPFDKRVTLVVGKKKYSPIDYDRRFNFKVIGPRDGMVFFPRYDPDTGKPVLEGAKDLRVQFDSSISHATSSGTNILWVWDLKKDRGSITQGKAANRLETDRLIKRSDKIDEQRKALQKQLDALNKEYDEVNSRIDELQAQ